MTSTILTLLGLLTSLNAIAEESFDELSSPATKIFCYATYNDEASKNVPESWKSDGNLFLKVHPKTFEDHSNQPIEFKLFIKRGTRFARFIDESQASFKTKCQNGPETCGSLYRGFENMNNEVFDSVFFSLSTKNDKAPYYPNSYIKFSKGDIVNGIRLFYSLKCSEPN